MRPKVLLLSLLLWPMTPTESPAFAQQPAGFSEQQFRTTGHKPLEGGRLPSILVGNTGYITFLRATEENAASSVNVHYWLSAGRVVIVSTDRDSGKRLVGESPWWIDGDRYCLRARFLVRGTFGKSATDMVRCRTLYDLGGVTYVCLDGECNQILRIVSGNPENL